jgi:hypothetical protein
VAQKFLAAVVEQARRAKLLSDEHFTVGLCQSAQRCGEERAAA